MKKVVSIILIAIMLLTSASCGLKKASDKDYRYTDPTSYQYAFEAFDTQCAINIYGIEEQAVAEQYCRDMEGLVLAVEDIFSKTKENGDVYNVNNRTSNTVKVSSYAANLFELAKDFNTWSSGKFDVSAGTLIDLWDVKNRKTLPSLSEINEARKHCGNFNYEITYEEPKTVALDEKVATMTFSGDALTKYDFGGLAKGYCCDLINLALQENKEIEACIVNLGGNVFCYGELKGRKGGAFHVGIFKPFAGGELIDSVDVKNRHVITSGDYQRYFKVEGDDRVYHHIIDPETGYPTDNDLDSVTIVSMNGLLGDYLSTACMLLGEEKSKQLIDFASKEFNDKDLQAIYVHKDSTVTKYPLNVNHKL